MLFLQCIVLCIQFQNAGFAPGPSEGPNTMKTPGSPLLLTLIQILTWTLKIILTLTPLTLWTYYHISTTTHNRFTALFLGPPGWAGARKLLGFMVQGKINRGRHTDHPAGCHSIRSNQCPPPPFPHFLQAGCPSCRPTNSVKALKATSAFRLGRRC